VTAEPMPGDRHVEVSEVIGRAATRRGPVDLVAVAEGICRARSARLARWSRTGPRHPIVPGRFYDDVGAAIEWLCSAFGFTGIYRYGPSDRPQGAFLSTGNGGSVALQISRVGQSPDWGMTMRTYVLPVPGSRSAVASRFAWTAWMRTTRRRRRTARGF
jgi:hypothetical protein